MISTFVLPSPTRSAWCRQRRIALSALFRARCGAGRRGAAWPVPARRPLGERNVRMSRSASAPIASRPSGISDRRVFSRVRMSSLRTSTSPAAAQCQAGRVLLGDHARDVSPRRVVTFNCQKLGSTSRLGSRMCASSSARRCAAHAVQRRPDVVADVAELVAARARAGEQRVPARRVAGLFDLGQQRGNDVGLGLAGRRQRVQQGRRPAARPAGSGWVRSRATFAGPRLAGVTCPAFSAASSASADSGRFAATDRRPAWSWCAPARR